VSVLSDEPTRERLRDAGIERAAGYTWERTASQMLEVFESALRGRSS
jgi:glycosyltransferase involved in cell wall biosynthesis